MLQTDYEKNASVSRTSTDTVYAQIIADLNEARNLLPADYSTSTSERTRPNKGAVSALLARTYLYTSDWENAEAEASILIDNNSVYQLENIFGCFFERK